MDPTEMDQLGVYWSTSKGGAGIYFEPDFTFTYKATFEAVVDADYIDVTKMIVHNFLFPKQEEEVTFLPYSPLWVEGVYITKGDQMPKFGWEDAFTRIDDWRRA
jgi:hypothetical protein